MPKLITTQHSSLLLANLLFYIFRKDPNEVDDYYSEHFVTQHGMLRELAIHQSKQDPPEKRKRLIVDVAGNNLPQWWSEQIEQPFNAHLVAFSTGFSLLLIQKRHEILRVGLA